jgi:phage shock protein A
MALEDVLSTAEVSQLLDRLSETVRRQIESTVEAQVRRAQATMAQIRKEVDDLLARRKAIEASIHELEKRKHAYMTAVDVIKAQLAQ